MRLRRKERSRKKKRKIFRAKMAKNILDIYMLPTQSFRVDDMLQSVYFNLKHHLIYDDIPF